MTFTAQCKCSWLGEDFYAMQDAQSCLRQWTGALRCIHCLPPTTGWGVLLGNLWPALCVNTQQLWPAQECWVLKIRPSRWAAGLGVHWQPQEVVSFSTLGFAEHQLSSKRYFLHVHRPAANNNCTCLLSCSHLVRPSPPLKTENFSDIFRKLPYTPHELQLELMRTSEPMPVDKKILCPDWLRPRSWDQSLARGWCYHDWVIGIRAKHYSWVASLPWDTWTWEVVCLGRNKVEMRAISYSLAILFTWANNYTFSLLPRPHLSQYHISWFYFCFSTYHYLIYVYLFDCLFT